MRRRILLSGHCLVVALTLTSAAWAQPAGDLVNLERVVIRGAETFRSEDILLRLRNDVDLWLPAPTTPLDEYLELLRGRLLQGYLCTGFGRAQVRAAVESDGNQDRILLTVEEGPRFHAGEVCVTGVPDETAQYVRRRLVSSMRSPDTAVTGTDRYRDRVLVASRPDSGSKTATSPKTDRPLWISGAPAAVNDASRSAIRHRIQSALAEEGYREAEFTEEIVLDGSTAVLHVSVEQPGPPTVIREIEVIGNEKDSDKEILRYLDLAPGQTLSWRTTDRIVQALWDSARFVDQRVETAQVADGVKLSILVREYAPAPLLGAAFSPEESACLRCRQWLLQEIERNHDFVFHGCEENYWFWGIASPNQGLIVELAPRVAGQPEPTPTLAIVVAGNAVQLYSLSNRTRFSGYSSTVQLNVQWTLTLECKEGDKPRRARGLALSLQSLKDGEMGLPVTVAFSVSPVSFLDMAHDDDCCSQWQGDALTLSNKLFHIGIDAPTGRLLEDFTIRNRDGTGKEIIECQANAFAERREALSAMAADWPETCDPERAVSSLVTFLASNHISERVLANALIDSKCPATIVSLASKLAHLRVIDLLPDAFLRYRAGHRDTFRIPPTQHQYCASAKTVPLVLTMGWHIGAVADDGWPHRALREVCGQLVEGGPSPEQARARFRQFDDMGPLACWIIASALESQSLVCQEVAALGLQRMNREAFLRDCRTIATDRGTIGMLARTLVEGAEGLTAEETQTMDRILHAQGVLERVVLALQTHAGESDPVAAAAGELWDTWLYQHLEVRLRLLQGIDPQLASPFPLPTIPR